MRIFHSKIFRFSFVSFRFTFIGNSPSFSLCLSKTRLYNVNRRLLTRQYFSKYSLGVKAEGQNKYDGERKKKKFYFQMF